MNSIDISFNQDNTCLLTTRDEGFKIYATEPFASCFTMDGPEKVSLVTMLYCTSLVIAVGSEKNNIFGNNMLRVLNTKKNNTICELTFPECIINIALNKKYIMVALPNIIHLYDISTMNEVSKISMHKSTKKIMSTLSTSADENIHYVVSVAEEDPNSIQIYDVEKKEFLGTISAHKSPVIAVAISNDGNLIATASKKGTIIRVFSVKTGLLLYEFRRGYFNATISQLSFDNTNSFLIVSSDHKSVHIFYLNDDNLLENQNSCMGIPISQCCRPVRNFISANTSSNNPVKIAAIFPDNNRILVATNHRNVYNYTCNFQNGGDASLYSHCTLDSTKN